MSTEEHQTPEQLSAFVAGSLDGDELAGVAEHLRLCEDCRMVVDEAARTDREEKCLDAQELGALIEKRLDPDRIESLRRHVSGCMTCRILIDSVAETEMSLKALKRWLLVGFLLCAGGFPVNLYFSFGLALAMWSLGLVAVAVGVFRFASDRK